LPIIGELTAHGPYITRPPEEVPEDAEWRSSRPVSATAYFDGLCEDLKSLKMLPTPQKPNQLVWEIWPADEPRKFDRWVHVSFMQFLVAKLFVNNHFLTTYHEQEAKEIYTQCHWPDLEKFQRTKCRRLLVDMLERCRALEKEERVKQPFPPAYTDASGRPISPPNL